MIILLAPILITALAVLSLLLLLLRRWRSACVALLLTLALNACLEQVPLHLPTLSIIARPSAPSVPVSDSAWSPLSSDSIPVSDRAWSPLSSDSVPVSDHAWSPSIQVARPASLRVLEYNICGKVEYVPQHGRPFLDYIRSVDADVVFLPENCIGTCWALDSLLRAMYPHSLRDFPEFVQSIPQYPDLTLYCRYPLTSYRRYRLSLDELQAENPFMTPDELKRQGADLMAFEVTADVHGRPVTFLHLHLRTNGVEGAKDGARGRRSLVRRLYDGLRFGYAFRAKEAEVIADSLRDCPHPLLIAGDFNDLSGSYALRAIQDARHDNADLHHRDRLRDAWWEGGFGYGFTFDDQHLLLRLDHILYSQEFQLLDVSAPAVPFSDHRPLIADFVLR